MVVDMQFTPYILDRELNELMVKAVNSVDLNGARFSGGTLTGLPEMTLSPGANGSALMNLKGIDYRAYSSYKGTKLGFISFECVNTLTINNINITGQLNTLNGTIPNNTIGMTANLSSSTNCDSNLSWILPIIGDLILNKAEGMIDSKLLSGLNSSMSNLSQKLLFDMNRLIPVTTSVPLPTGGNFNIGEYIRNNLPYLLSNGYINVKLGKGADLSAVIGQNEPPSTLLRGDALSLTVNSPSINFSAVLSEEVIVNWQFKCSVADPSKKCNDPR
jgi:hypothetical protein